MEQSMNLTRIKQLLDQVDGQLVEYRNNRLNIGNWSSFLNDTPVGMTLRDSTSTTTLSPLGGDTTATTTTSNYLINSILYLVHQSSLSNSGMTLLNDSLFGNGGGGGGSDGSSLDFISIAPSNLPMPINESSLNNELGLGPIRDPLWTTIPMTILYVLILVTGVVGNVVTCAVIAHNRYMHTATNYYLFSLAISDLLLLVLGLPQEIQQIWQRYPYAFGEAFCVLRGFTAEASTNSSVLTITAFTIERYVAICHPLRSHTMSKLSRAVKLIVVIWFLGFFCAAPIAYQLGIVFDLIHGQEKVMQSANCNIKRHIPILDVHIFALQSLLVFVLPVTLISVLYVLIGIKLRQSSRQGSQCGGGGSMDVYKSSIKSDDTSQQSTIKQPKQSSNNRSNRRRRRCTIRRLGSSSGNSMVTNDEPSLDCIDIVSEQSITVDNATKTNTDHNSRIVISNHNNNDNNSGCGGFFRQIHQKPLKTVSNSNSSSSTSTSTTTTSTPSVKLVTLSSKSSSIPTNSATVISASTTTSATATTTATTVSNQRNRIRLNKFTSSSTSASSSNSGFNSSLQQRRAVIKMLTAVVVAFFVCFAPFHAQRLMAIYVKNPSNYETFAFQLLTYISGVTYYLSATINPILYSIMSVRFRQAFHDTFVRTFCPSKSAIFNYRARSMSQMYHSNVSHHHQNHHHPHHPLNNNHYQHQQQSNHPNNHYQNSQNKPQNPNQKLQNFSANHHYANQNQNSTNFNFNQTIYHKTQEPTQQQPPSYQYPKTTVAPPIQLKTSQNGSIPNYRNQHSATANNNNNNNKIQFNFASTPSPPPPPPMAPQSPMNVVFDNNDSSKSSEPDVTINLNNNNQLKPLITSVKPEIKVAPSPVSSPQSQVDGATVAHVPMIISCIQ